MKRNTRILEDLNMVAVAVSCSGNSIRNNNEVTLRRAWLVVGWVYSTSGLASSGMGVLYVGPASSGMGDCL